MINSWSFILNYSFGDDVKQQSADPGGKQRHADVQPGEQRHQHCRAKHDKGMLDTHDDVFAGEIFLVLIVHGFSV